MNQVIREKLEKEYERTLEDVSTARNGSEEAEWALKKLSRLNDQMIAITQTDDKCYMEAEKLRLEQAEIELKKKQAKEGRVFNVVKIILDGAAIFAPLAIFSKCYRDGLDFEKNGTYGSRTSSFMSGIYRMLKK